MSRLKEWFLDNGMYKLVALFIALSLWSVVTGRKPHIMTKVLPLKFITPEGYHISNNLIDKIHFRLKGPMVTLRRLTDRSEPISIDLSNEKSKSTNIRIHEDLLDLPNSVEVLMISPSQITIEIEKN